MKASTAAAILAFCATSMGAPVKVERRQPEAEAEPFLKSLAENFGGFGGIPGLQAAATLFGKRDAAPEPFLKFLADNLGGFGGIPGLQAAATLFGKRDATTDDTPEFVLYSDEDENVNEKRDASPEPFLRGFGSGAKLGLRIGSNLFGLDDKRDLTALNTRDAEAEPFLGRGFGTGAKLGLRIGSNLFGLDDKRDLSALEARDAEAEPFLGREFGTGAKLGLKIGSNLFGFDDKRDLAALEARDAEAEPFLGRGFGTGAKLGLKIGSNLFGFDDKRDLSAVEKREETAEVDDTPEFFLYSDEDETTNEKREAEPFLKGFGSGAKLGLKIGSNLFGFGDDG